MRKAKTKMELYRALRREWKLRPVTKVKESAKVYKRKEKHQRSDDIE